MQRRQFLAFSSLAFLAACHARNFSQTLTISVAASLQDSMQAIANLYQVENPDINLIYNFGGSGALRQQIEQGAPVNLFISAASRHMDILQDKGLLLSQSRRDLLNNDLAIVVPKTNRNIHGFLSLNLGKTIAIGEPDSVPAGYYARQALEFFGLYESLRSQLVFAKDVRQVLSYVSTGNADAGIVYATDAKISPHVNIIDIAPPESHDPIIYPVAIIKNSKSIATAEHFVQFLSATKAQDEFRKYGFK
ncbi:molybdate ABC transporter substrate-binding protein [Roseofilum casamattae]|uniref:Molybdate ABC transporter substrate-binding protein n=1 Tax=Roseofilum casamattae BLCC-M143 TaxID=3022442 RepID=A0ABT7BW80_9CYAN|nr:molybdate ABC transporter substrate-binding protein [Roseofilum casamattae]MDJ1183450.1 molybdate ABC transporter substrate-binding protein [Roseofilum casamattae BLCC-M143]